MLNEKDYKILSIGIKSTSNIDWNVLSYSLREHLLNEWSGRLEYPFFPKENFTILKISNKKISFNEWESISQIIRIWLKDNYSEKFGVVVMGKEIIHKKPFNELPIEKQIKEINRRYEKRNKNYKKEIDKGKTIEWHWINDVIKINKDNYDWWLKNYGEYK